jgi:hypothetical protein
VFDKIGDMPLHPLAIHAPVIGIPLAFLLSVLFAFPRTRRWARWPLAITAVGAAGATFVARESGLSFEKSQQIRPGNPVGNLIAQHAHYANQLLVIMIGFAIVALVNALVVSRRAVAGAVARTAPRRGPLNLVLLMLLLIVAAAALFWVVRVGDIGARAVWNPTSAPLF